MKIRLIAQVGQPPTPQPTIIDFLGDYLTPGAVVIGLGAALWWFVKRDAKALLDRVSRLEEQDKAIAAESKAVELLNSRQSDKIDVLLQSLQKVEGGLESLAERQKEMVQLGERVTLFDKRFEAFGAALQDLQRLYQEAQRESMDLKSRLAGEYVRRDDWIRFSQVLEAKQDEISRRLDEYKGLLVQVMQRGGANA